MKRKIYIISAIFITFALLFILQKLLMPKYIDDIPEGALVGEYYKEEKNHDVLFVGDCEVYETFSPKVLLEEYGIKSYIRGSANQLIWQSYYLLEEMLKYEKPKVVVYNVLAMKYGEPQKESYNRMTLDGMKWSDSKVKAIKASMLPEEKFITYVFPLLRFHSRWSELKEEDFKYIFNPPHFFSIRTTRACELCRQYGVIYRAMVRNLRFPHRSQHSRFLGRFVSIAQRY